MSDPIERQAAIAAMTNYFARWAEYTAWSKTVKNMVETAQEAVREMLAELPSAQPEGKDTNVPSTDLISRQAAIDALDMLCQEHRYKIPGKWETYSQYNEAWQDALDRAEGAIGNLPPAQSEPQWIPCSERLPRNFQPYYATCRSNIDNRENWVIEGYYTQLRGFNPPPLVADGKAEIIAWMPKELPEPYKGE